MKRGRPNRSTAMPGRTMHDCSGRCRRPRAPAQLPSARVRDRRCSLCKARCRETPRSIWRCVPVCRASACTRRCDAKEPQRLDQLCRHGTCPVLSNGRVQCKIAGQIVLRQKVPWCARWWCRLGGEFSLNSAQSTARAIERNAIERNAIDRNRPIAAPAIQLHAG